MLYIILASISLPPETLKLKYKKKTEVDDSIGLSSLSASLSVK